MQSAWGVLGFEIISGQIWNVPDVAVTFEDRRPEARTTHEWRYVLILQADDWDHEETCETILVAPLSSRVDDKRAWEARIEPAETHAPSGRPAIGKSSLVKLQLTQPIHRTLILDSTGPVGSVRPLKFEQIQLQLAQNLSITIS